MKNPLRLVMPVLIAIWGAVSATGSNTTWYVPGNFATLSNAVNAAADGDTIVLKTNLWTECGIVVTKTLTITGLGMTNTILQAATTRGTAANRIFQMNNTTKSLVIKNMTLRYGFVAPARRQSGGGAIFNAAGTTTVQNCVLTMNDVLGKGGTGGGAIVQSGMVRTQAFVGLTPEYRLPGPSLIVSNCLFFDNTTLFSAPFSNTAAASGGAICAGGYVTIDSSSFVSNSSAWDGGAYEGIDSWGPDLSGPESCTVIFRNSTFFGNRCPDRGGAINLQAAGYQWGMYNCTVVSNSAYNYQYSGGLVVSVTGCTNYIISSIFAGNRPCESYKCLGNATRALILSNCLCQSTFVNAKTVNCITGDPLLNLLSYNGGATPTLVPQPNSPVINHGANPLNLSWDQRGPGYPRARGTAIDIGACQLPPVP